MINAPIRRLELNVSCPIAIAILVAITALIGFITAIVVAEIFLTAYALTIQHKAVQNNAKKITIKMFL